jgi:hypothetical protein
MVITYLLVVYILEPIINDKFWNDGRNTLFDFYVMLPHLTRGKYLCFSHLLCAL